MHKAVASLSRNALLALGVGGLAIAPFACAQGFVGESSLTTTATSSSTGSLSSPSSTGASGLGGNTTASSSTSSGLGGAAVSSTTSAVGGSTSSSPTASTSSTGGGSGSLSASSASSTAVSSSSASTGVSSSSSAASSSSGTIDMSCDNQSGIFACTDCTACATTEPGPCSNEIDTCNNNSDCAAINACIFENFPCSTSCQQNCVNQNPGGSADYLAMSHCETCACENNCSVPLGTCQ